VGTLSQHRWRQPFCTTRKQLSQRSDYPARLILALAPTCVAASIPNFVAFKVGNFIEAP